LWKKKIFLSLFFVCTFLLAHVSASNVPGNPVKADDNCAKAVLACTNNDQSLRSLSFTPQNNTAISEEVTTCRYVMRCGNTIWIVVCACGSSACGDGLDAAMSGMCNAGCCNG